MSECDEHIMRQRYTLAALYCHGDRADLWAICDGIGLATLVLREVLSRAEPTPPTVSAAQWQRECLGMMREQAGALAAMLAPGWPRLTPRAYRGGVIDD